METVLLTQTGISLLVFQSYDTIGWTWSFHSFLLSPAECGRLLEHALRLTGDWHENKQRRRESGKNSISRLPWNPLTFFKFLFASRSKDGNINHSHLASSSLPHAPPLTQTVIAGLCEGGGEGNGCSQSQDDSLGRWRWPSEESSSQPCFDTFSM